jgi:hypothetical protein
VSSTRMRMPAGSRLLPFSERARPPLGRLRPLERILRAMARARRA